MSNFWGVTAVLENVPVLRRLCHRATGMGLMVQPQRTSIESLQVELEIEQIIREQSTAAHINSISIYLLFRNVS